MTREICTGLPTMSTAIRDAVASSEGQVSRQVRHRGFAPLLQPSGDLRLDLVPPAVHWVRPPSASRASVAAVNDVTGRSVESTLAQCGCSFMTVESRFGVYESA